MTRYGKVEFKKSAANTRPFEEALGGLPESFFATSRSDHRHLSVFDISNLRTSVRLVNLDHVPLDHILAGMLKEVANGVATTLPGPNRRFL